MSYYQLHIVALLLDTLADYICSVVLQSDVVTKYKAAADITNSEFEPIYCFFVPSIQVFPKDVSQHLPMDSVEADEDLL